MEIADVFETMYLAQSKDESEIPFSSRPCPKPADFFFLRQQRFSVCLVEQRLFEKVNGFLILTLFSEDLLFSNKKREGKKQLLEQLSLLLNFDCNSPPLRGHKAIKI